MFSKLKPVNSILLKICKDIWQPSSSLTMDKCISRFIKRVKEKITIPTKLILTEIKAWVLSDNNYFMH